MLQNTYFGSVHKLRLWHQQFVMSSKVGPQKLGLFTVFPVTCIPKVVKHRPQILCGVVAVLVAYRDGGVFHPTGRH